jgi:hypothetical protein
VYSIDPASRIPPYLRIGRQYYLPSYEERTIDSHVQCVALDCEHGVVSSERDRLLRIVRVVLLHRNLLRSLPRLRILLLGVLSVACVAITHLVVVCCGSRSSDDLWLAFLASSLLLLLLEGQGDPPTCCCSIVSKSARLDSVSIERGNGETNSQLVVEDTLKRLFILILITDTSKQHSHTTKSI